MAWKRTEMIRITDLFTTPLADVTLPDHEPVCEELRQLFLEREKEGDAHRYHKRRETQFGERNPVRRSLRE
jgi:hypothetical protein